MTYIKVNEDNTVTVAGQVANQAMINQGYFDYQGTIPNINQSFQHYEYVNNTVEVVDDNSKYSNLVQEAIQKLLDSKAKEFRYDDMKSARAVAGIPLLGNETASELAIYNEAVLLAQWYLKCWGKASEIEQDIINGVITTKPTIDEVLSQLPPYN